MLMLLEADCKRLDDLGTRGTKRRDFDRRVAADEVEDEAPWL